MTWKHTTELPDERQLVMIVLNDKIVPEVFIYSQSTLQANGLCIEWREAQAWFKFKDLPKPDWLIEQIENRETIGLETVKIAATYRQGRENLFGEVVDPDDV